MRALAVALALAFPALPGCCPPWICGWELPDRGDDEDPPSRDDEEDDDAADDDEGGLDALTFAWTLDVAPPEEHAGDDDSADDDDSAAGARDDGPAAATGELVVRAWRDVERRILLCEQRVAFAAEVEPEAEGCAACDAHLRAQASSARDVSDPVLDPDACTDADREAIGFDPGIELLTPAGIGGLGDFLSVALLPASEGLDRDLVFAPGDGLSYAEQADALAELGVILTHGGYVRAGAGGLVVGSGIDQVAGRPEDDADWFAFFRVFRDPDRNGWDGPGLRGAYGAQGIWVVYPR